MLTMWSFCLCKLLTKACTHTDRGHTHTVASCLWCVVVPFFQLTVVPGWFSFTSPPCSLPRLCPVMLGKCCTQSVGGDIIIHFPLFGKLKLWYRHQQLLNSLHCATVNLLSVCCKKVSFLAVDDRLEVGGSTKGKNNLALGSRRNLVF